MLEGHVCMKWYICACMSGGQRLTLWVSLSEPEAH